MPKSRQKTIHLGFEVETGDPVSVPLHHTVCTGLTGLSGKTTALEALIHRSGMRALVFRTKRGETDFKGAVVHAPFFRERADWQYVQTLLEATMREKMKFERSWIIKACRGANSLQEVQANIERDLEKARGINESVLTTLKAYLDLVLPWIGKVVFATKLKLKPGVNVMDLVKLPVEVQALVIASTLEELHARGRNTIVVVPEAWKFVPQDRGSPVKVSMTAFIREGRAVGLWLFIDSQDLAGVDKPPLKSVDIWILGRVKERNEVGHFIDQIPVPKREKPKPEDFMTLGLGQFYVVSGNQVRKVYVQPAWMSDEDAQAVAQGRMDVYDHTIEAPEEDEEDMEKITELEETNAALAEENDQLKETVERQTRAIDALQKAVERLRVDPKVEPPAMDYYKKLQAQPASMNHVHREGGSHPSDRKLPGGGMIRHDLHVGVETPNTTIREEIVRVDLTDREPEGRVAILVSEGAFDTPQTVSAMGTAFRSRGWGSYSGGGGAKSMKTLLMKMTTYGLLRTDGAEKSPTFVIAPGAKARLKKVRA